MTPPTERPELAADPLPPARRSLCKRCTAWLAIFLALLVWRRAALDSPPYWDQAFGLWMEANFLAETGFDYHRLRTVEPPGTVGGSRGYVISVLPTALAALMLTAPSDRAVLLVAHAGTLALAAATAVGVFHLARRWAGDVCGALLAALTLIVPVFSVQVELVGLEIPLVACAVASLGMAASGRSLAALVGCWAAFLMKATGMMFTWALTLVLLSGWLRDRIVGRPASARQTWAALLAVASSGLQIALAIWGTMVDVNRQPQVHASFARYALLPHWCPDVLLWLVVCGLGCGWVGWRRVRRGAISTPANHNQIEAPIDAHLDLTAAVAGLVTIGILSAVLVFSFIPRYLVPVVPCLAVLTAWSIGRGEIPRQWAAVGLAAAVVVCLANQDGRFFPAIEHGIGPEFARTGAVLERSREYWNDHQDNLRLVQYLTQNHRHDDIVAGHPLVYFLSLPRLGYVAQPLHGYTINPFTPLVDHFTDLTTANLEQIPTDALFVYAPNTWYRFSAQWSLSPPEADDPIVWAGVEPGGPVAYRVNWESRGVLNPSERHRWFVRRLWPWRTPLERAVRVSEYWTARGERVEAARAVQDVIDRAGDAPELDVFLGNAWHDAGHDDLAVRWLLAGQRNPLLAALASSEATNSADDRTVGPMHQPIEASLIELSEGRAAEAIGVWRSAVGNSASTGRAELWLGLAYQSVDDHPQSIAHLERAISNLDGATAAESLALARLALGLGISRQAGGADNLAAVARALDLFQAVIDADPSSALTQVVAEAHHEAGLLLARQGERGLAADHFRKAVAARPCWTVARDDLTAVRP